MNYTCSICLEKCNNPAILKLNCECKYYVHYTCMKKWWNIKGTCIICKNNCEPPLLNKNKNNTFFKKDILLERTFNRYDLQTIQYERYLNELPFDNENELKTIVVSLAILIFSLYIIFYLQ